MESRETKRAKAEESLAAKLSESRIPAMKIDTTLNLNTLLGAASLLISGALAYSTLDKRVAVVEEQTQSSAKISAERSNDAKESLREIKGDLKDLKRAVEEKMK